MKVILLNARMSFNDIFTPKAIGDNPDPKFSITAICGPDTKIKVDGKVLPYTDLEKICQTVLKERFNGKVPPKAKNWAYNKADGSTTRDEYVDKEGEYWGGFDAETMYVSASKKAELCKGGKIKVMDQEKNPIEATDQKIFSGCYVNVIIDIYAFDAGNSIGCSASLEGVQLKKKGEPLGISHIDADEEFEEEEFEEADDLM